MKPDNKPPVILVHGILMPCIQLIPMQKRLEAAGFEVHRYCYATISQTMQQNADGLADMLASKSLDQCCFVGHSMGGLVIHRFLQHHPDFPPCRVVALGSPFGGSVVARRLSQWPLAGSMIIGKKRGSSLEHGAQPWPDKHRLGVIAGDKPLGIGCMLARLPKPHDGVVSLAETAIPGMSERVIIPVNHMGLMFSAQAARLTERFLEYGSFGDTAEGRSVKPEGDKA